MQILPILFLQFRARAVMKIPFSRHLQNSEVYIFVFPITLLLFLPFWLKLERRSNIKLLGFTSIYRKLGVGS